jgi:hypothetical protein
MTPRLPRRRTRRRGRGTENEPIGQVQWRLRLAERRAHRGRGCVRALCVRAALNTGKIQEGARELIALCSHGQVFAGRRSYNPLARVPLVASAAFQAGEPQSSAAQTSNQTSLTGPRHGRAELYGHLMIRSSQRICISAPDLTATCDCSEAKSACDEIGDGLCAARQHGSSS